ncbi:MAG: T9SS type A sorting domain-containing protein, partial [Bacteroidetes bacterium]|nr:T9SS type A sorting domain-containing protein [Bacteroidota bacterium]
GGITPYSYNWNTGCTDEQPFVSAAGTYTITITDANGCTGTDEQPFVSAGTYTVTVTDANACEKIKSGITINSIGGPVITIDSIITAGCGGTDGSIYVSVTGGSIPYLSYIWSDGTTTEDLVNIAQGVYNLTVTDSVGCAGTYSNEIIAIVPIEQPICIVSVDSATGRNRIMWEKVQSSGISHYNIYREGTMAGFYYKIAEMPYDSMSIYTDLQANPMIRAWRYKISAVDACDNESVLSTGHKTIHMTMNVGVVNHSVNLIWDHYGGFPFWTYYLHRHTNGIGWETIDSLPNNLTSYTDFPPNWGQLFYRISVIKAEPCYSSSTDKAQGCPYSQSFSNLDDNGIYVGISEKVSECNITIYPNPNDGVFNLVIESPEKEAFNIEITNINGQLIISKDTKPEAKIIDRIDLSKYPKGIYFVKIKGDKITKTEKIIFK